MSSNIPLAQARHKTKPDTHGVEKYILPSKADYHIT